MNEKDAIEIIIEAFEDARGSIYYRDEIQAVNCLEDYVKNSISKDKIREIIYPSPDNYIPVEVQMSEMYRKIEKLVKEE